MNKLELYFNFKLTLWAYLTQGSQACWNVVLLTWDGCLRWACVCDCGWPQWKDARGFTEKRLFVASLRRDPHSNILSSYHLIRKNCHFFNLTCNNGSLLLSCVFAIVPSRTITTPVGAIPSSVCMQLFEQHPHEPNNWFLIPQPIAKHPWLIRAAQSANSLSETAETLLRQTIPLPHCHLGKLITPGWGYTPILTGCEYDPNDSSRVHTCLYSSPFSSFWELQEKKRMQRILRISSSVTNEKLSNRCGNYNALWDKVFNGTIQSTSRVFNPLELILHLLYYNWNGKT